MGVAGVELDVGRGRRRGAVEQARAHIAHELDTRRFAPGDRLPSADVLATEVGVSRPAVLQALQLLQAEGRVLVRPGRAGTIVVEPEPDNLDSRVARLWERRDGIVDFARVRDAMEPGIARMSAENGLDDADADLAADLIERMRATDDASAWLAWDYELHRVMARGAGKQVVDAMVAAVRATATQVFEVLDLTPALRRRCDAEHARILAAILGRRPAAAERAMAKHVRASRTIIEQLLAGDMTGPDDLLRSLSDRSPSDHKDR